MRRLCLLLLLAVGAASTAGQELVPVLAEWDGSLESDPAYPLTTYELDRDGVVYPCAPVTATRCAASVPAGSATWRLRGVNARGAGPWSDPVPGVVGGGTAPPGAPSVLSHLFSPPRIAVMPSVETFAAPNVTDWTASGGTQNFTVDGGSGANRVMYAYVQWRYDRGHTLTLSYNAVALSEEGAAAFNPINAARNKAQLYRLVGPASGDNTFSISASTGTGGAYCSVHIVFVQDADQTTTNGTVVHEEESGSDAATTQDVSVSSESGDLVLMFAHFSTSVSGTTGSVSGSSYTLHQQTLNPGPQTRMISGSAAGAATVTPATTYNNSAGSWGATRLGVNINAAAATPRGFAGPVNRPRMFLRRKVA